MKKVKYYLILFILLISPIIAYYLISINYPLNNSPRNYWLARLLASTVIAESSCSNLETMRKTQEGAFLFSCQKIEESYTIYVFSNDSLRKIFLEKTRKKGIVFIAGRYFLIKEDTFYGNSKNNKPRPITINSYEGFKGEVFTPSKK